MASSAVPYKAGEASVWFQPSGANTRPEYLGCHEVGDIAETFGDSTILYCPDPAQAGKFKAVGSYQGEPGAPTFSITTDVNKVADYLEGLKCPGNLFVHKVPCGRRDNFTNYERTFILRNARPTGGTLSNLAVRDPGSEDRSTQSWDMAAEELIRILQLGAGEQSNAGAAQANDITFFNEEQCASSCGPATALCQKGVVVGKSEYSHRALLMFTDDGGTWTDSAADPFAVAEDISKVVAFTTGRGTYRVLLGLGTTRAGEPAHVGYSDDLGATWALVHVGSHNGEYITSLFAIDQYHIWAGTDHGYIFFSEDGGLTWSVQEAGVISANDVLSISFSDDLNGVASFDAAGAGAMTADGGVSWGALTIPGSGTAHVVVRVDEYNIWVGEDDGTVWYSMDGGVHFSQRAVSPAPTSVLDMAFVNPLVGFMVGIIGTGTGFYRTIDGGYTWETVDLGTTAAYDMLAVHACDENNAFLAGWDTGPLTKIVKVFPA